MRRVVLHAPDTPVSDALVAGVGFAILLAMAAAGVVGWLRNRKGLDE